jgi:hypothetical protein
VRFSEPGSAELLLALYVLRFRAKWICGCTATISPVSTLTKTLSRAGSAPRMPSKMVS